MNQKQKTLSYDQFMPRPLQERIRLFNEVSAENRALLVKTHIERWLVKNQSRLTEEQIAVVDEVLQFAIPENYGSNRNIEKLHSEIQKTGEKAAAVFSREDIMQILSNRADYLPIIKKQSD